MRRRLLGGISEGWARRFPGRKVLSGLLVVVVFSIFMKGPFFASRSTHRNGLLTHASVKEDLVQNKVVDVNDGDGSTSTSTATWSSSMPKRVLEKLSVSQ